MSPQSENFAAHKRFFKTFSNPQTYRVGNQEEGNALTATARNTAESIIDHPPLDPARSRAERFNAITALVLLGVAIAGSIYLLFGVASPTPIHFAVLLVVLLVSGLFAARWEAVRHDSTPSRVTVAEHERYLVLARLLAESGFRPRSWLDVATSVVAGAGEAWIVAYVVVIGLGALLPSAVAIVAAAGLAAILTLFVGGRLTEGISIQFRQLGVRETCNTRLERGEADPKVRDEALRLREEVGPFVNWKFHSPTYIERACPWLLLASIGTVVAALVGFRLNAADVTTSESLSLIVGGAVTMCLLVATALSGARTISAGGREGEIANQLAALFPRNDEYARFLASHKREVMCRLNAEFIKAQGRVNVGRCFAGDKALQKAPIVLDVPFPEERTQSNVRDASSPIRASEGAQPPRHPVVEVLRGTGDD